MTYRTLSSLENQPQTAQLLGNLTVAWSHAERVLYFCFWVASGTEQSKAFDTFESMNSFKSRYDLVLTLFKQDADQHPKLTELIARLSTLVQCSTARNEFAHRTWVMEEATGNLLLLDHRMSKKTPKARPTSEEELQELIVRINSSCDAIFDLLAQIYPANFQSPGTQA